MELWQRSGFESFGAWRRASEVARRAAKRAAKKATVVAGASPLASTTPAPPPPSTDLPLAAITTAAITASIASPIAASIASPITTVSWETVQILDPPSAPNSPFRGNLRLCHEQVQSTPDGSRAHTITLLSPGGTRVHEYVSPAGAARGESEERSAWRRSVRDSRRLAREAAAAAAAATYESRIRGPDWRRTKRCWECAACLQFGKKRKNADGQWKKVPTYCEAPVNR
mmetsp:Transcript_29724/g.76883  ORF Transcript_29724/g.76883 Transcript_29724/m.76883 type:complete len:228 (+) Transcript_29724:2-685(+)